jgi:hypothetical protein
MRSFLITGKTSSLMRLFNSNFYISYPRSLETTLLGIFVPLSSLRLYGSFGLVALYGRYATPGSATTFSTPPNMASELDEAVPPAWFNSSISWSRQKSTTTHCSSLPGIFGRPLIPSPDLSFSLLSVD